MRTPWCYALILAILIMQQRSFIGSVQFTKPMNTVSVVGNRVKMECSNLHAVLPVDWEFASFGSNSFSRIFVVGSVTKSLISRYKIDTDNRTRYDIVIDSVDLSHAGIYRCIPITEKVIVTPNSARLIVLASDPVCGTNISALNGEIVEGEYIQMQCTVNYTGNWILILEWAKSNGRTVDANIVYTNTSTTVASSWTVQLHSSDNGATFTCRTSMHPISTEIGKALTSDEALATNIPQYQHLWNFSSIILYAPRNLTIVAKKSEYEFGDRLECWADGNPHPVYRWMDIETNRTIYAPVLTIDDYMTSEEYSFSCTACKKVADCIEQVSDTVTFTVTGKSQISTDQLIIIIITIAGAVLCLALILYLCNNRYPYKRDGVPFNRRPATEQNGSDAFGQFGNLRAVPEDFPVYADVQKRKESLINNSCATCSFGDDNFRSPQGPIQKKKRQNRVGADGTVYVDLSDVKQTAFKMSTARAATPPDLCDSNYAYIDHTARIPPPPPPPPEF